MKSLLITSVIIALVIGGVWALRIAYPPVSEAQVKQIYLYNDWVKAVGDGNFALADEIKAKKGI